MCEFDFGHFAAFKVLTDTDLLILVILFTDTNVEKKSSLFLCSLYASLILPSCSKFFLVLNYFNNQDLRICRFKAVYNK